MRFIVAAVALAISAASAHASVIYSFTQTGASSPGTSASGTLVISDAAYAAGINFNSCGGQGSPCWTPGQPQALDLTGSGIESIAFRVLAPGGEVLQAIADGTTNSFSVCAGCLQPYLWLVSFTSTPSGVPIGTVIFNNLDQDFVFSLNAGIGTGQYATDLLPSSPCAGLADCTFSGTWAIAVPEPASMALLGMGLLGLAATRRRRTASV